MKKLLGRNDMEDGLKRLDTLTQEEARMASAQLVQATQPADNRVRVMMDKELDAKDNVVSVDSRGRGVRSREAAIDDKLARVIIGVQPSSICDKGCFDHDTPRWKRSKGSRAADSQR
jgi:hypothetical protein